MEMKYVKNPVQFLRETGLLFDINRQVLHPFGLALAVVLPEEGDDDAFGTIQIIDNRDDKEGIAYSTEAFVHGLEKMNKFMQDFGVSKWQERMEEMGYIVQEHADPYIKKNGISLVTYNVEYDINDPDYKDIIVFRVPYEWLSKAAMQWYGMTIDEFLNEYTYDLSEPIYQEAKEEGVIIEEEFMRETP